MARRKIRYVCAILSPRYAEGVALEYDFADRKISTYSGGQKRRLDVASCIMHQPDVLFLDEPTTGLDPQNRANLWGAGPPTPRPRDDDLLTTNYLEEADALCHRLAIIDHARSSLKDLPRHSSPRSPATRSR
jgi:ABC-2 type transport system ATP-binding protein